MTEEVAVGRTWTKTAAGLVSAVALMAGLAACGGGIEPRQVETGAAPATAVAEPPATAPAADPSVPEEPDEDASPVELLDVSIERTATIESARFEMVFLYDTGATPEFPVEQMRATGQMAEGGTSLQMVMESVPATAGSIEQTIVDGIAYLKVPGGGCQTVDLSDLLGGASVAGGSADPSTFLQQLRGITGDVVDLGPHEVRGVATTHYSTAFTPRQSLASVPAEQAEALEDLYATLPDSFLDASQEVDVFIDDDGLLRRMQIASPSVTASGVTVPPSTTILDYFDFGADITIEAPTGCSDGFESIAEPMN